MTFARKILRPFALICAGVLVCLAGQTALGAQQERDRRYGLAVVRADGVVIPFAEYDRGRWREIWSGKEDGGYALPITLQDVDEDWWGHVDPSSVWQLWQRPGVSEVLTVTGLRPVRTPCGAEAGLTTTHKPPTPAPPPDTAPYPKAGLATTAGIQFAPVPRVDMGSPEWNLARETLEEAFDDLEARQLYAMQWSHPVGARDRRDTPISLKAVMHVPGSRFYYVEATRAYADPDPPADAPPCGLVTYIAGFLWRNDRGVLVPVSINTLVSFCHLEEARYLWPLGVIREAGRTNWVVQSAGWTGEAYAIVQLVEERGQVLNPLWHNAGECGRR